MQIDKDAAEIIAESFRYSVEIMPATVYKIITAYEAAKAKQPSITEAEIRNKINGALKECIEAHGSISSKYIGSATKRIVGKLRPYLNLEK